MARYTITSYDATGTPVKVIETDAGEDGPEFYAQQALHADAITRVSIHNADTGDFILNRDISEVRDGDLG